MDVFEQWANEAAWMGFNESNATDPGSWENLVELLMRGLHKRVDWITGLQAGLWGKGICLERGKRTFKEYSLRSCIQIREGCTL